jgi:hypothetical protein
MKSQELMLSSKILPWIDQVKGLVKQIEHLRTTRLESASWDKLQVGLQNGV